MVLFLLGACRGQAPLPPLDPADPSALVKRLQAHLKEHPEDDQAWRDLAHVQWLHQGDTAAAEPVLDRLAAAGDSTARISRMLIAQSRNEPAVIQALAFAALKAAAGTPAEDRHRRLRQTEATLAARLLGESHGDRGGDDERFVAMFDALHPSGLPFAAGQPLMSLRAAIARRHGEDYRAHYRRQGCVQRWQAGPMEGTRGDLELGLLEGDVAPDPAAAVVPLACVVRVWNPSPSPGVRRLWTAIESRGGPMLLNLGAQESARFYVDGTLVHRTDTVDRYAPSRVLLELELAAGWHRVEVHTAVPAERAWVLVRAFEPGKGPAQADPEGGPVAEAYRGRPRRPRARPDAVAGLEGPIYAPLRAHLAVADALADGDSDRAERALTALDDAERFPQGALLRARVERADPSRGQAVSTARELEALEQALALDPSLDAARLRMLEIQRDRGDDAEVEKALSALEPGQLSGIAGELLRFRVFLAQGNEYLAEQALGRAARQSPTSCRVLIARRSLARERADVAEEDEIAKALEVCAGSLSLRARLAESRGRWDEARELWTQVLERTPDDLSAHENLARVQALRGALDDARSHLETSLRYNPFRVGGHLALADLAATHGDFEEARAQLQAALAKVPHSNALWRAASELGIDDDLMRWRADGAAALADYRASGATYEGVGEVLILDRSTARVYKSGGQRQIVHLVVHLLSKEALDRYGERNIPAGAELLLLRTIKPDGRTIEPELVPGKDGLSLRHLEIGDVVELEFIVERPPAGPLPGYVDVSTFRFQSNDVPYHRTELVVVHPPEVKIVHDARNNPPVDEVREQVVDGRTLVVHRWRADEVPRLGVEPGARPWLEELPSVHVYTRLDLPRYLDSLAAQIRGSQRRNPELRALVRRLVRGQATPRAKLEALWTWVVENVEDTGDLSVPASATLAARTGNRLMLLRAMLQEAGLRSELWLARDSYGPRPLPGGHPLVDTYEAAMLAVSLPGADEPLMVITASKVMPLGYLAPGYRGTDGMRVRLVDGEPPSGPVTLPGTSPGLEDRRRYEVALRLDGAGAGTVAGTITLEGMEAILWRQALRQIDRDRVEEVFQQAELGWLPGATLEALTIEDEEQLERPLVLRFSARSSNVGVLQDGALVMRASPMPLNPGAPFTALPRRTTGLVVPYAPVQEAELRYTLAGATFTAVPPDRNIESPFGRFERTIEAGGEGKSSLTVRLRSSLRTGVVEATRYEALTGFTRQVEGAAQEVLRAR